MFTGLVEGIGSVGNVLHLRDEIKATISPRFKMTDWQMGESICVDGVCLTLTDFDIDYNLGPAARQVELFLSVEGIRQ